MKKMMRMRVGTILLWCGSLWTGSLWTGLLWTGSLWTGQAEGQAAFAVATIRPRAEQVKFESDGATEVRPGVLRMRDVTIETCIKWAYGVQRGQVAGPALLVGEHYDIQAKAEDAATEDEMKLMMQALLAERFKLTFHREKKEMLTFALMVAKGGPKLKRAAEGGVPYRENSAVGTVARSLTMQELADFLSGPVERPMVDRTGLEGRYDFAFDFTNYLVKDQEGRPDFVGVLNATLQGEVGLKLERLRALVEVMVVDHVEKPSAN